MVNKDVYIKQRKQKFTGSFARLDSIRTVRSGSRDMLLLFCLTSVVAVVITVLLFFCMAVFTTK